MGDKLIKTLEQELSEVDAALKESRKDTERLDWLERTCSEVGCNFDEVAWTCGVRGPAGEILRVANGRTIREAIDNAMESEDVEP